MEANQRHEEFAAHQYEHFEFEVLWHTLTEELTELKEMLLPLI